MPASQASDSQSVSKNPFRLFLFAGLTPDLSPYHYRQGFIFNTINATGFSIGLIRFIYILLFLPAQHTPLLLFVNLLSVLLNVVLLTFMYFRAYAFTVYFSFIVYPVTLLIISIVTGDRGVAYYLFPCIIYSFFFLNSKVKIFTASIAITIMFIFAISIQNRQSEMLRPHDQVLEMISLFGVFVLSAVTLFSIKFQIWDYQDKIKAQRYKLQESNMRIAQQAKKLNEIILIKDKVFSIISHDIRSPLQGLYLIVDADINDNLSLETVKQILPELKEELKKAFDLFDNLLNWAKVQIKEAVISISAVDAKALADKVKAHLARAAAEKGVVVNTVLTNYHIQADKDILEIVLRNLVSNAIKFSHPNTSVSLTGKMAAGFYEIVIKDSGTGISPEKLNEINSKSFYTSPGTNNEQGTGLGLIICQDLVEKCKGSFTISSQMGSGTTITITLPQAG